MLKLIWEGHLKGHLKTSSQDFIKYILVQPCQKMEILFKCSNAHNYFKNILYDSETFQNVLTIVLLLIFWGGDFLAPPPTRS